MEIPLKVTNQHGDEIEVMDCSTSILWPWDFLAWMWEAGVFLQWVSDDPLAASDRTVEYWSHCTHLDFFQRLDIQPDQFGTTIPLYFHADGVKIYKAQKAWVYSVSSACRKGASLKTKLVIIILRESRTIKEKSHDAIGNLMGYITKTLMSGCFPGLSQTGLLLNQDHQKHYGVVSPMPVDGVVHLLGSKVIGRPG